MAEQPLCRHFIACDRIERVDARGLSLHKLTTTVKPADGEAYPLMRADQCFLAVLSSGTGRHRVWVDYWRGVGPFASPQWVSPSGIIDLGGDPLAVHTVAFRYTLLFEHPGQYEFRLMCEAVELANLFIEARRV